MYCACVAVEVGWGLDIICLLCVYVCLGLGDAHTHKEISMTADGYKEEKTTRAHAAS